MARKKVMKQTNGLYPAPLRILEVVRAGLDKGPEGGYEAERTKFGELVVTSEAKGLISLFHGQTECKKNHFGAPAKRSQTIGRRSIFFFWLVKSEVWYFAQSYRNLAVWLCRQESVS
jgi:hypothetical protein